MSDKITDIIANLDGEKELVFFSWDASNLIIQTLLVAEIYHKNANIVIFYNPLIRDLKLINFKYLEAVLGFTLLANDANIIKKLPTPDYIYFFIPYSWFDRLVYSHYASNHAVRFNLVEEGMASYSIIKSLDWILSKNYNIDDIFNWSRFSNIYLYNPEFFQDKDVFNVKKLDGTLFSQTDFVDKLNAYYNFDKTEFDINKYQAIFIDQHLADYVYGLHVNLEFFFLNQLNKLLNNKMLIKAHPLVLSGYKYENFNIDILTKNIPFELFYLNMLNQDLDAPIFIVSHFSTVILNLMTMFNNNPNIKYIYTYKIINDYLQEKVNEPVLEILNNNDDIGANLYIPSSMQELAKILNNSSFNDKEFKNEERTEILNSLKQETVVANKFDKVSVAYLKTCSSKHFEQITKKYFRYHNKIETTFPYKNDGTYDELLYSPCLGVMGEIEALQIAIINQDSSDKIVINEAELEIVAGTKQDGKITMNKRNSSIKIKHIPIMPNGMIEFKYKITTSKSSFLPVNSSILDWDYPCLSNIWLNPVNLTEQLSNAKKRYEKLYYSEWASFGRLGLIAKVLYLIKKAIKAPFKKLLRIMKR